MVLQAEDDFVFLCWRIDIYTRTRYLQIIPLIPMQKITGYCKQAIWFKLRIVSHSQISVFPDETPKQVFAILQYLSANWFL